MALLCACSSRIREDLAIGAFAILINLSGAAPASPQWLDIGPDAPSVIDKVLWGIADARFDGRNDLIRRLNAAGHDASSDDSDTHLALHAYRAWGLGCLDRLIGDFSFVIWDDQAQRLLAARDHFGVRPLYHARFGDQLIISNRLTAIRAHQAADDSLAEGPMLDWIGHGYPLDQSATVFRSINRVPAAHCLELRVGSTPRVRRYWSISQETAMPYSDSSEIVEEFIHLLDDAVRDRLRGRKAVISMSGGLDSTMIAASAVLASTATTAPLAQTLVYRRLIQHEEGHWAAVTARHLGIRNTQYPLDDIDDFAGFDDPSWRRPEPTDDSAWPSITKYRHEAMLAGATVELSGYGGDVVSYPEPEYLIALITAGQVGLALRHTATAWRHLGHRPPLYIRSAFRSMWRSQSRRDPATEQAVPHWLNPQLVAEHRLQDRWKALLSGSDFLHPLRPRMAAEIGHPLWAHNLESEDPSWTGIPLEQAHPFFDLRLVRFALRLPPTPWCSEKLLFRRAGRGRLPKAILSRPKTPLASDPMPPVAPWLQNDPLPSAMLRDYLRSDYAERSMIRDGFRAAPRSVIAMDGWLRFGRNKRPS